MNGLTFRKYPHNSEKRLHYFPELKVASSSCLYSNQHFYNISQRYLIHNDIKNIKAAHNNLREDGS